MASSKPSDSHEDVSRLLKQLRMDSFEFRSFDRPGSTKGRGDEPQFDELPAGGQADASAAPSSAVPRSADDAPVDPPVSIASSQTRPPARPPEAPTRARVQPAATVVSRPALVRSQSIPAGADAPLLEIFGHLMRQTAGPGGRSPIFKLQLPQGQQKPARRIESQADSGSVKDAFDRLSGEASPRVSLVRRRD